MRDLVAVIADTVDVPGVLLSATDCAVTLLFPEYVTKTEQRPAFALRIDVGYSLLPTLYLQPDGERESELTLPLRDRWYLWRLYRTLRRRIYRHDAITLTTALTHLLTLPHADNDPESP